MLQELVLGFRREKQENLLGIHLFDFDTPENANSLNNTFLVAAADFPAINFPKELVLQCHLESNEIWHRKNGKTTTCEVWEHVISYILFEMVEKLKGLIICFWKVFLLIPRKILAFSLGHEETNHTSNSHNLEVAI